MFPILHFPNWIKFYIELQNIIIDIINVQVLLAVT